MSRTHYSPPPGTHQSLASPPSMAMTPTPQLVLASSSSSPVVFQPPPATTTTRKAPRRRRPSLFSLWQLAALIEADVRLTPLKTFVQNNLSLWHYEHQLPRRHLQPGRRHSLFVRRLPDMYLTPEESSTPPVSSTNDEGGAPAKKKSLRDEVLAALDVSVAGYKELLFCHDKVHTNTLVFVEAINRQFPTKNGPMWRFGLRGPLSQDGKELTSYVKQRQEEVMRSGAVFAKIEALWSLLPKDHRGFLAKSTHARIFYDFFKVLAFDVVDETLRMDLVRRDWELRADGRLSIDGSRFCVSMRCTVDVWCETNDPQEAIDFLSFVISVAKRTLLSGDDELQRGHGLLTADDGADGGAGGHGGGAAGHGVDATEAQGVSTVALRDGRKQVEDLMVRTLGRRNVGLHSAEDVLRRRQQLEESRNNTSPMKRLRGAGGLRTQEEASLDSTTSTVASSRRKAEQHHITTSFATSSLVSFVVALTTPGSVPRFDVKSSLTKRMEATETIVASRGDVNGLMAAAEASIRPMMLAPPTPSVLSKSRVDLNLSKSQRSGGGAGLDASGRPGKDDSFSSRGTYASLKCLVPRKVKTTLKPNMEAEFLDRYGALDLRLTTSGSGGAGGPPPLPTRPAHLQQQQQSFLPSSVATLGRGVVSTVKGGDSNAGIDDERFDPLSSVNLHSQPTRQTSAGRHHRTSVNGNDHHPWSGQQVSSMFLDSFGADVRAGGSDEESNDNLSNLGVATGDGSRDDDRGVVEVRTLGIVDIYGTSTSATPPPQHNRGIGGGGDDDDDNASASFERGCGNDSLVLLDSVPASPSGTPRNASMSSFRGFKRGGAASPRGASFVRRALRRANDSASPPRGTGAGDDNDSDDSVEEALALVERHFSKKQSMFRDARRKSRQASEALRAALARPVATHPTVGNTTTLLDDPSSSPSSTAPLASPGTMASSRASSPPGLVGSTYTAPAAMGRLARTAAVSFRVRPDEQRTHVPVAASLQRGDSDAGLDDLSILSNSNMRAAIGSGAGAAVRAGPPPGEDPADQLLSSLTFSVSTRPPVELGSVNLGTVAIIDADHAANMPGLAGKRKSQHAAMGGGRQGSSSTLRRRNTLLTFAATEIDDETEFQKNMITFVHELTDNMTLEEQEAHRQASTYEDIDSALYAPLAELTIPATLIRGLARWRGPMHCTTQNDLYSWFDPRLYGVVSSVSLASLRRFSNPFVFAFLLDPWTAAVAEVQQPRLSSPASPMPPRHFEDATARAKKNVSSDSGHHDNSQHSVHTPPQMTLGDTTTTKSGRPSLQLRWYYERLPSMDPSDEVLGCDVSSGEAASSYGRKDALGDASMDVGDWVQFGEAHSASLTQLWADGLSTAVPLLPPPSQLMAQHTNHDDVAGDKGDGGDTPPSLPSFPMPAYGFDYSPIRDGRRCKMVLSVDFTTWRCGYDAVPIEDEEIGGGAVVAASPLPLNRRRSSFALSLSAERVPHHRNDDESDGNGNSERKGGASRRARHLVRGHRICAHWAYLWEYQNPTATAWYPFPLSTQSDLSRWMYEAKRLSEEMMQPPYHVSVDDKGVTRNVAAEWTSVSVTEKLLGLHKYRDHCLSLLEDFTVPLTPETGNAKDMNSGKRYFAMTSWSGAKHMSVPVRYQVLFFSKAYSVSPLRIEEDWRPAMPTQPKGGERVPSPASTPTKQKQERAYRGGGGGDVNSNSPITTSWSPARDDGSRFQHSLAAAAATVAASTTTAGNISPMSWAGGARSLTSPLLSGQHQRLPSPHTAGDEDSSHHHTTEAPFQNNIRGVGSRSPQTSPLAFENISFVEESARHALLRGGESEDGDDSRSRPASASTHSNHFISHGGVHRSAGGAALVSTETASPGGALSPPLRHLRLTTTIAVGGPVMQLLHNSQLPMQSRRFPLRCPEAAIQAAPACVRSTYATDMFQKAQRLLGSKVDVPDSTVRTLDPPRSMSAQPHVPTLTWVSRPQSSHVCTVDANHPPTPHCSAAPSTIERSKASEVQTRASSATFFAPSTISSGSPTLGKKSFRGTVPIRSDTVPLGNGGGRQLSQSAPRTTNSTAGQQRDPLRNRSTPSAYCRARAATCKFHVATGVSSCTTFLTQAPKSTPPTLLGVNDYAAASLASGNRRLLSQQE